ncbi:hypothetical protein PYW07_012623 [Mythimna separata]|uniref:C2H2-type domain-containing protein n=1 Tax=Mythimna separata TaxID=271217 RepID=A0AAD7Y8L1_MYTSE|nr:hypothetical protein PYW07_012623 [Mythimna separata]
MTQLRCYTCLELDRKLTPLKPYAKYLFTILCPEIFHYTRHSFEFNICWECESMANKIIQFQKKLKKGNEILKLSLKGKAPFIIEGLSTQTTTKIEIIDIQPINLRKITLPRNQPFVQLTQPNLQQTQPIIQQIQPIIQQTQPIIQQTQPNIPPHLIISPQNILQLSLKDMLEAPSKLHTQTEIKLEPVDEENCGNEFVDEANCSNDFDELIPPYSIQQVSRDPLLVPMENQKNLWAEIEVPPLPALKPKPVKTEIVTPIIDTLHTEPPIDQAPLRGFKEVVKVTVKDSNVTANPVRKNDLLTKLLQNPSKGEDLLLTRQPRLTLPNMPKEAESTTQSTETNFYEDEAKVIVLTGTEMEEYRNKKRLLPLYVIAQYKCEKCIVRFKSQEKLDEHNLKHDKSQGNSVCGICEQRFADKNLLNDHYRQHFIVYECMKCSYRHSNRMLLSTHIRNKHEESCFYCKKCFQDFKTHKERRFHMIKVHDQKIACKQCKKTFANASRLKAHIGVVHNTKTVSCPICKKNVKTYYLKNHVKIHTDQGDNYYCADCGTFYKTKFTYELHLKTSLKHNTLEKLGFKCDHCNEYFPNKESLRRHIEALSGAKYTCDICKKNSKSKKTLIGHIMQVHQNIRRNRKPKICEFCGKSFTVQKSLVEHLNLHLGIRPHECKDCGATFIYSAALFTHRRLVHKVKKKSEMTS